jgi:nucleoside recognition membrane protein YjiH
LLIGVVLSTTADAATGDIEWINSKYHNLGANWKIFTGIIVFMGVTQTLGLVCEWSYNKSLNKFLKAEDMPGDD